MLVTGDHPEHTWISAELLERERPRYGGPTGPVAYVIGFDPGYPRGERKNGFVVELAQDVLRAIAWVLYLKVVVAAVDDFDATTVRECDEVRTRELG